MARSIKARKTHRYSYDFKIKAVQLSHLEGIQVKEIAEALDIHPFMLSRWRTKEGSCRPGPGATLS